MTVEQYIDNINQRYLLENATEHTFRGDLQQLLESLVPQIRATNEPKRQACGAPDYILTKKGIPLGFIEAKNIGDKDLAGKNKAGNKEQFDRYKASLNNLIFTDYLEFHLYHEGEFISKIAIAEKTEKGIKAIPQNFAAFRNLIKDFCVHIGQSIKSPKKLAEMMAGKARLLADVIAKSLISDTDNYEDSTLKEQMLAFKNILIHDITAKSFADVYAQTIAYGMFAARLHDPSLGTFTRQKAAELIPKSNPFLRKLFGYIAGPDIDDRIKWIVDNLAEIFLACDVEQILKNYGKSTKMEDPIIHFYEDFLTAYDPKLRKARGVWYTPQPVVNFIVRAVDSILETEFGLNRGLANTSKTTIKVKEQGGGNKLISKEVHKVQILDPATGTGTFLTQVVKFVHQKYFKASQGIWSSYVENDLIPRLNGFELLMASYAMAHLKLDMLLQETGYKTQKSERLNIYLTNSLEEHQPNTSTLFSTWLSTEANEANRIKRDTPVMCVIGNPPYAVSSSNKGAWIQTLLKAYKKDLNERNIQPLSDDYIKFIRFGEHFINKTGEGVLAYISNNSFLDGVIHRQMRKHLLETFDKIYILNLHGNAKMKETALDGSFDQNVFDIMQGVSINIFIKTSKSKKLATVFQHDLYGKRQAKFDFLTKKKLQTIKWKQLKCQSPYFFFVPKNFKYQKKYELGFGIDKIFPRHNAGTATGKDAVFVAPTKEELSNKLLKKQLDYDEKDFKTYNYRLFDKQVFVYDNVLIQRLRHNLMQHFLKENIGLVSTKLLSSREYAHCFVSTQVGDRCYISNKGKEANYYFPLYLYPVKDDSLFSSAKNKKINELSLQLHYLEKNYKEVKKYFDKTVKPFYEKLAHTDTASSKLFEEHQTIYEEAKTQVENTKNQIAALRKKPEEYFKEKELERVPNLDEEILSQIAKKIDLEFVNEKTNSKNEFAPIDMLDYIYAILHSPTYREKYKEFLKIDFPRVPYPKNASVFWKLVKLGGEIRQIHLLESPKVEEHITTFPKDGNNTITTKIAKKDWELFDEKKGLGRIWINDEQYFDTIPLRAWEFYIGGYQPAQKWLKDRKTRTLDFDDIFHYQKIIVALFETDRLMKEIDKIELD